MSDFINCDNNGLTDEQIMAALITKDDDGNFAFRTMFVDACSEDAIDCSNNSLPISQLSRKTIGLDPDCGKPAIRLANKKAAYLNGIQEFADDTAAGVGGLSAGDIYWNTTSEGLVSVQA